MSLFIPGDSAIYTSYCQHQKSLITAGWRCDHTATQQQERGSRVHKSSENPFPCAAMNLLLSQAKEGGIVLQPVRNLNFSISRGSLDTALCTKRCFPLSSSLQPLLLTQIQCKGSWSLACC